MKPKIMPRTMQEPTPAAGMRRPAEKKIIPEKMLPTEAVRITMERGTDEQRIFNWNRYRRYYN